MFAAAKMWYQLWNLSAIALQILNSAENIKVNENKHKEMAAENIKVNENKH